MHVSNTGFDRLGGFLRGLGWLLVSITVVACSDQPWNSPYPPDQAGKNILYSSFSARPKHLDPAQSYSSNEVVFTGQIYEPPLQYHFLKRPYQLEPLTATHMPEPYYLDARGERLTDGAPETAIAFSVYDIEIKPGIQYQPHPAFAKDVYHHLNVSDLDDIDTLADFPLTGSRELVAADYVYEIKRLAHPHLHSPIFGLMADYIVGLKEYAVTLREAWDEQTEGATRPVVLKLDTFPLEGATVLDRYHYRVMVRGKYPHAVFCTGPLGGRCVLQPAGHEGTQYQPRLVSGRHRAIHADGEQPQSSDGAGAQS